MKPDIEKVKLLIVDDHQMIRDGLRFMLELQKKKYTLIIDEAENGEDGIEKAKKMNYDLIMMDYQLPKLNGVETTISILNNKPQTKVLALSNYHEHMHIANFLKAGARGFALKNIGPDELVKAIDIILDGKNYYSNEVAVKLINFKHDMLPQSPLEKMKKYGLSKREIEVLKLIALENTNDEIACKLFISRRTVDSHRQSLLNKLKVKNSMGLVKFALELNLLD